MTDTKKTDTSVSGKVATAGLVGLAVGAASVYLSDKKNQDKVAKKIDEVRSWSDKTVSDLKVKVDDKKSDAESMIEDLSHEAKDMKKSKDEMEDSSSKKLS